MPLIYDNLQNIMINVYFFAVFLGKTKLFLYLIQNFSHFYAPKNYQKVTEHRKIAFLLSIKNLFLLLRVKETRDIYYAKVEN